MAKAPKSMTIRSYNVGFGDCFLVSFRYGPKSERHILIDFGSTSLPKGAKKSRMMDIALDIEERTGGKLDAVVATHRHRDHISGFETKANGKGTGDVIRRLNPTAVVQPWTEDPELGTTATGPTSAGAKGAKAIVGKKGAAKLTALDKRFGRGAGSYLASLNLMDKFAGQMLAGLKGSRALPAAQRQMLSFMGETNLKNLGAVKNLMSMGKKRHYVHTGSKSGLESLLPGVTITVMGPPTVKQDASIKTQRAKDPDEFWHLQAAASRFAEDPDAKLLFPRHIHRSGPPFPIETRWLVYHARQSRAQQLLSLVRMLDDALNNTSVILLFDVGGKRILFPGDAQIENWRFALNQPKYANLLKTVNLYKVGHHGSLNATPKSLWKLFARRSPRKGDAGRMMSLLSTMEGKHGSEASKTEVPRQTLVNALERETEHFSTQTLKKDDLFRDVTVTF